MTLTVHTDYIQPKTETSDYEKTESLKKYTELDRHHKIREFVYSIYKIRFNVITQKLEFKTDRDTEFRAMEDIEENTLFLLMLDAGFKKSDWDVLKRIVYSDYTPKFNPFLHYFDNLIWDGKDHITHFANSVTMVKKGAETELEDGTQMADHWPSVFKQWLVSAVAGVLGRQNHDVMLVFIGKQGRFKTTWLNRLCPPSLTPYLFTGHIIPSSTDNNTANYLAEKFIVNLDDQLEVVFNKDFNSLKNIITAAEVTNRKAYAKHEKKRKRVCSWVASVNSTSFLTDVENRRYACFEVEEININHAVDINQVWAQAYHLLKQGADIFYPLQCKEAIRMINNLYKQVTPEEEFLKLMFSPADPDDEQTKWRGPSEILSLIKAASGLNVNPRNLKIEGRFGFQKISKRIDGKAPAWLFPVKEHFTVFASGKVELHQPPQVEEKVPF